MQTIGLIGQSVLDRTQWPDGRIEERLGGAPIFAARAIADVWPAVVLTHGGGTDLRRPLHDLGLHIVEGPSQLTTVFEVTLHGDGTWSEEVTAIGDPFTEHDLETWMAEDLAECTSIVCGTQLRGDFTAETLAVLGRSGRRLYLDGQGPARPRRLGPIRLEGPLDLQALQSISVLKLGEDEADTLIGGIDAAAAQATGVPVVVVTRGEQSAVVLSEGLATEIRVDPVLGLADTVGAGDSFLALMAAAEEDGADSITATRRACDSMAGLLRRRLATERAGDAAATGLGAR
ncbi:MAG: PfkB family carbohydrate kinase [Gaiellaceae bacterium]